MPPAFDLSEDERVALMFDIAGGLGVTTWPVGRDPHFVRSNGRAIPFQGALLAHQDFASASIGGCKQMLASTK